MLSKLHNITASLQLLIDLEYAYNVRNVCGFQFANLGLFRARSVKQKKSPRFVGSRLPRITKATYRKYDDDNNSDNSKLCGKPPQYAPALAS